MLNLKDQNGKTIISSTESVFYSEKSPRLVHWYAIKLNIDKHLRWVIFPNFKISELHKNTKTTTIKKMISSYKHLKAFFYLPNQTAQILKEKEGWTNLIRKSFLCINIEVIYKKCSEHLPSIARLKKEKYEKKI